MDAMTPWTAVVLRRILDGRTIGGSIRMVHPYLRGIAWQMLGMSRERREGAWVRYLDDIDPSAVRKRWWSAVSKADPDAVLIP